MKTIQHIMILILLLYAVSCRKDTRDVRDPVDIAEQELITTVNLIITDSTGKTIEASFRDPDGEGGNAPLAVDTIKLQAFHSYPNASIEVTDESKVPVDNITEEIADAANDHQFFYHPGNIDLHINYDDEDNNGLPVGIKTKWETGSAGSGTLEVILKHQPGIKSNNENAGATDMQVTFPVVIR